MHRAAYLALSLNYLYLPFDIPVPRLPQAVQAFRLLRFRGFNVTVPFKERIVPLLDELSPEARTTGAVNTVRIDNGRLTGFNTDGYGFSRSLRTQWRFPVRQRRAVILGAGGAARGAACQLAMEKIGAIGISNRTRSHSVKLKGLIRREFPGIEVTVLAPRSPELKDYLKATDLLVNTTPLGLRSRDPSPVPAQFLHPRLRVFDLIYNPPVTPLIRAAAKAGSPWMNGAHMLLYQGARAFEIWTGKKAPLAEMAGALSLSL
jgi:shikimate dehydrogenase